MYGQPRDQGSNPSPGSRTEPVFFQSPSPASVGNGSGNRQKNKPPSCRRVGMEPEIPEVGTLLLAVYETAEECRAGILLVKSAVEIEATDGGTGAHSTYEHRTYEYGLGADSRTGSWLGRISELQLDTDYQAGQRLQWAEAIELSSDQLLYSEVLVCKLKSEHVAACRSLISRLQSIARMLEMSRGSG